MSTKIPKTSKIHKIAAIITPNDVNLHVVNTKYRVIYRELMDAGYTRSFGSMGRQIRKIKVIKPKPKSRKYPKSKFKPLKGTYPGEYVEIDIKFVPMECIGFHSDYNRYYQITAIDLFSRKRTLKLVNENSIWETSEFLYELEDKM